MQSEFNIGKIKYRRKAVIRAAFEERNIIFLPQDFLPACYVVAKEQGFKIKIKKVRKNGLYRIEKIACVPLENFLFSDGTANPSSQALKTMIQNHEKNILKNVIEKAEGLSERLVAWASAQIKKIDEEIHELTKSGVAPQPAPSPTPAPTGSIEENVAIHKTGTPVPGLNPDPTESNGIQQHVAGDPVPGLEGEPQPAAPSVPVPSAPEPDADAMTVQEMRATGAYTEDQIKALCAEYNVPYETPSDAPAAPSLAQNAVG